MAYCISKGVFQTPNEMFDNILDRSLKVCEREEEFADMDVFDIVRIHDTMGPIPESIKSARIKNHGDDSLHYSTVAMCLT